MIWIQPMAVMVVCLLSCADIAARIWIRSAQAAAARRSGRTTGRRRRWRRVNSRRSWLCSSKPFAGVGVAYACREEAEAEDQHENVQHGLLLVAPLHACGQRWETCARQWP